MSDERRVAFRVLGCDHVVTGPSSALAPIERAYRRFRIDGADDDGATLAIEDGQLHVDGRAVPAPYDRNVERQLYQNFVLRTMDRVDAYAVVHAAFLLDARGDACLLAAPSGHGKSSLALTLADGGVRLGGDDYAPVALDGGRVHPFPRAIAVSACGSAPLPARVAARAAEPGPELFGKRLLDIGDLFGENALVDAPVRLGSVLLLEDADTDPRPSRIDVGREGGGVAEFGARLAALRGVDVEHESTRGDAGQWSLRVDPLEVDAPRLSALLAESGVRSEKRSEEPPRFRGVPSLRPITRREAADALCTELLNRRSDGALMRRFGGSLAKLFFEFAGTLRNAECRVCRVGDFPATVAVIRDWLDRR